MINPRLWMSIQKIAMSPQVVNILTAAGHHILNVGAVNALDQAMDYVAYKIAHHIVIHEKSKEKQTWQISVTQ